MCDSTSMRCILTYVCVGRNSWQCDNIPVIKESLLHKLCKNFNFDENVTPTILCKEEAKKNL